MTDEELIHNAVGYAYYVNKLFALRRTGAASAIRYVNLCYDWTVRCQIEI